MKSFLKTTLAVICGIIITSILSCMFVFSLARSMAGGGKTAIPKDAVLKIDMSQLTVAEQSKEFSGTLQLGSSINVESQNVIGIWDAVQGLNAAAADPSIKYIYLKVDGSTTGMAHLQELRAALKNFRACGKPVIAYSEAPSTGAYYLASVADKIYLPPYLGATYTLTGISGNLIFIKDLLDKLGVNVQLIRHGKYKSAGEMFIRNSASPENMEQNQVMINSMWNAMASEIAESRSISVGELNGLIDNLELCSPEDFINGGLADELLGKEELENKLADLAMVDKFSKVKMIGLKEYWDVKSMELKKSGNKIAVIYADGDIVDGNGKQSVAGDRFAREIAKVRADSTVKVAVLRVNSPGGSVLASEKIKTELDLLKQVKPVVASYGEYAASGGYWISNNADKIFSNPTTLTGSIGVFGMIPDFSKTVKDVAHVTITSVKSNRHSDMYSLMRPFDSDEYAYMQKSIEQIYDKFVNIVAEGRGMEPERVDEIAQGRVWTGADALGIGLVDELGTLEDAIKYAATLAGDPDPANWNVTGYPKPASQFEEIMSMFSGKTDGQEALLGKFKTMAEAGKLARMPYEIIIR